MNHFFCVDEASRIGVEKAVILSNFRFWLEKNRANNKNIHDGYFWTYNSSKALAIIFPYWSPQKISRLIRDLESDGELISGNFNKVGYDRTKWYSMPEFSIVHVETFHCSDLNNGVFNNKQPIPDINTDNKPSSLYGEIIDAYIGIIGEKCKAKSVFKNTFLINPSRLKPLVSRVKENPEHQKIEFWENYFLKCSEVNWIRDGIDGEPVCTLDMLVNKTKFEKLVEGFWA